MISLDNTVDAATLLKIIQDQQVTIEKLSARLEQLLHLLYGTKTEKRRGLDEKKEEADKQKPERTPKDIEDKNASKGRRPLPSNLARVRIIHDLPLDKQYCPCGCKMNRMGQITKHTQVVYGCMWAAGHTVVASFLKSRSVLKKTA